MIRFRASFILMAMSFIALGARAEVFEGGAISAGTAGAGRASPEPSESVYLNPASLGFLRGYFFSSGYASESQTQGMNLSITDAMKDTIFPAGVAYQHYSTRALNNTNSTSQDIRLSTAERFANDRWSFGLGAHQRSDELANTSYNQVNGVAALTGYLGKHWMLGATWEDFFKESQGIPEQFRLESRETIGLSYLYRSTLRIKMDYLTGYGDSYFKPSLLGGLENYWNRFWGMRIGLGRNMQLNQNIFSLGLGFKGPKFSLQYAYIQGDDVLNLSRHVIDLTLPLW